MISCKVSRTPRSSSVISIEYGLFFVIMPPTPTGRRLPTHPGRSRHRRQQRNQVHTGTRCKPYASTSGNRPVRVTPFFNKTYVRCKIKTSTPTAEQHGQHLPEWQKVR